MTQYIMQILNLVLFKPCVVPLGFLVSRYMYLVDEPVYYDAVQPLR